jgi:hypothetical protein
MISKFRLGGVLLLLALPGAALAQPRQIAPGDGGVIQNVFGRFDARIAVGTKSFDSRILKRESRVIVVDAQSGSTANLKTDSSLTFYDIREDDRGRLILYAGNSQGGVFQGTYYFIEGSEKVSSVPLNIDGHDMLVESDGIYAMKYVPESTRFRQNLHLALYKFDARLEKVLWSWDSKGRFALDSSTFSDTQSFPDDRESLIEKAAKRLLITVLSPFDVKYPVRFSALGRQLRLPTNDYLHANSIIRAPNGNLWISMRHQDAILEIDERSGSVVSWIGGAFSKKSDWRIVGDPLSGFSHQHSLQLRGDELYVFDNGNRFDNRTSRVVVYRCDFGKKTLAFVKDFPEPNGLHRPTQGSVRGLDGNHILVGWGGLLKRDAGKPQRGVSIFAIDSGREIFGFDLDAGLDSYNANAIGSAKTLDLKIPALKPPPPPRPDAKSERRS